MGKLTQGQWFEKQAHARHERTIAKTVYELTLQLIDTTRAQAAVFGRGIPSWLSEMQAKARADLEAAEGRLLLVNTLDGDEAWGTYMASWKPLPEGLPAIYYQDLSKAGA
jgi:hypothetical protein